MHAKVRLTIYNDTDRNSRGFGRGIVMLLENIEETGSIKKAAKKMEMAYSKAWKILTETESEFDIELLKRYGHRGSFLSPQARFLLNAYKSVLDEINNTADIASKRYLYDIDIME
jgi:molybdate transport system regulatory protein